MTVEFDKDHIFMLFRAFEESVKENGRRIEEMPKMIEMQVSYDQDFDEALRSISMWRTASIPNVLNRSINDPRELEKIAADIELKQLERNVYTSMDEIIKQIEEYIKIGSQNSGWKLEPKRSKIHSRIWQDSPALPKRKYSRKNQLN